MQGPLRLWAAVTQAIRATRPSGAMQLQSWTPLTAMASLRPGLLCRTCWRSPLIPTGASPVQRLRYYNITL